MIDFFDAIGSGLLTALGTNMALVYALGFIAAFALILIGIDPILSFVIAGTPFVLLAVENQPDYGVAGIIILFYGFAVALAIYRMWMR